MQCFEAAKEHGPKPGAAPNRTKSEQREKDFFDHLKKRGVTVGIHSTTRNPCNPYKKRISLQAEKVKTAANQIVMTEKAVSNPPISLRRKFTHWQIGSEIVKQN